MKLRITALFILTLATITIAQTNVSGIISSDSTFSLAGSPYIIIGNLTVNDGVTLTVENNVTVKFNTNTRLTILGSIIANSAVFTSSEAIPAKGNWGTIKIGDYYHTGSGQFTNCQIMYGGNSEYSNLFVYKGSATLNGTIISHSKYDGVKVMDNASVDITGCDINNCSSLGLYVTTGVTANITNTTIQTCEWPIRYDGAASVIFNEVNDLTGNTHDGILMWNNAYDSMVWDTINVPYVLKTDFTIKDGETLVIAPTNVVKSMGGHIFVNGALNAYAPKGESIYFTSYKDDNLMGDTNGDSFSSAPQAGDWFGIYFRDQSDDASGLDDDVNILKRCTITFAGRNRDGAVTTDNASPTIDSCSFANNYYGAKFIGLSSPNFSNNDIGSSQMVPVAMSFEATPEFNNNSFPESDNQYDAIGILGGTLRGNALLPQRDFTDIANVTYLLLGAVIVPDGITLTINEGVVIKSYYYSHRIRIAGKLVADGTEASPIIFTSAKDDLFGNPKDTNKDGTSSVPAIGNWGGIAFENGSDPTSIMDNCILQFGALPYSGYYVNGVHVYTGALTLISSSPTISNCTFKDVTYAIYASAGSNPSITNCSFNNTTYTPVIMSVASNPTFSGNILTNPGIAAIGIAPEKLPVDATIMKRAFGGFDNITYALMGDLVINSGAKVTVEPGIVIKSWSNAGIFVKGGFKADGATGGTTEEIVFTSIKDDNAGNPGDSNGDGNGSSPNRNDWETIQFEETSDATFSKLNHCSIKFSGQGNKGGVTYKDAAANVTNSTISNSFYGIVCEGASTPNVSNVLIENCQYDPIAMSLKSDPTFSGIEFTANGSSGIKILEGTLSSDATLVKRSLAGMSNIAYIINSLTISPNAVLTIEPGVVIKFNIHYYYGITVNGALVANGTKDKKIIFTSIRDDSNGGDTNNDGNVSVPAKGNWRSITFNSSSLEAQNILNNCAIRYGGNHNNNYEASNIRIYNTIVEIDSCSIEQSYTSGIGIFGSASPIISNSEINNISGTPIVMSMFSTPTFSNNEVANVGVLALGIKPEKYSVDATIPIRNFGGFTNITYYLYGTSTINSGTNIIIPAGIVFKNGKLDVKGGLLINGVTGNEVVFTDVRDDDFGNPSDTNGDGMLSSPRVTGTRIKFYDVSNDDSEINHAIFRYSDIAVHLDQASPSLADNMFQYDNWGAYLTGVSTPELIGCVFYDLKYAPMRISLVSYPRVTAGNIIIGTTYKAIAILENESLVQDVTLDKKNFAGITNIPYLFGNYTVASNAILTIDPGVVLKFFPNTGLRVRKGLMALGTSTPDGIIVFTDLRDDFYGGDTNSDSTDSTPWDNPRGWGGIVFEDEALDRSCKLDYATIQYAGHYYYNNHAAIYTNSASPQITNSVLKNNYTSVALKGASNPTINYCDIYNNSGIGINNIDKSFIINAENNWWGSDSGPTHSGNPGGTGVMVSDAVDYDPWLGSGASNPIIGDVSLNGIVQAFDASKILKHVVGSEPLAALPLSVADVSGDGSVLAYDASLVLQYSVGLISSFPAEVGSAPAPQLPKMDSKTKKYLALQKAENVSLFMEGAIVNRGEEFLIPISISNTSGVTAVQLEININKELYKLSGVTLSKEYSQYNMSYWFNDDTQKLIIAVAGTKPMETEGEFLTLSFAANEEIRGKVSEKIDVVKFYANENDLTKSVTAETIEFIGKPTKYSLEQNYPNPFNPSTIISYQIPDDNVNVKLIIYNIKGEVVNTLVNTTQNAGRYKVTWNASNKYGGKVSSGIYIYRISAGSYSATKKLMVLK